jgi:hypothetical protein
MSVFKAELRYDSAEAAVGLVPGSDTEDGREKLRDLATLALTVTVPTIGEAAAEAGGEAGEIAAPAPEVGA